MMKSIIYKMFFFFFSFVFLLRHSTELYLNDNSVKSMNYFIQNHSIDADYSLDMIEIDLNNNVYEQSLNLTNVLLRRKDDDGKK